LQIVAKALNFLFIENLAITLVMALGAAAMYLLLPRPRAQRVTFGAGLGVLAILLGGVLFVGSHVANPEVILFYAFSAVAVIAGGLLVTQRNPARAALSFALVVLCTCGLFLLLAAPFLMAATVIIYAGAIIVTFLFVLMLAQQEGRSDADDRSREPLLSAIAGFVLLGALLYVLHNSYSTSAIGKLNAEAEALVADLDALLERESSGDKPDLETFHAIQRRSDDLLKDYRVQAAKQPSLPASQFLMRAQGLADEFSHEQMRELRDLLVQARDAGSKLPQTVGMLLPPEGAQLSELSGPASNRQPSELRHDETGRPPLPAENTAYLGRSLFTDYLLAVELGGTLLLVATVGAIAIAHQRRPGTGSTDGRTQ
jgi:NADH:ubiquinone oxidoreductase subunit 6 (subunit J)